MRLSALSPSAQMTLMMKIDTVAAQPDRAGRHTVRFEDGTVMHLYRQTVEDFGLYAGLELSAELYKQLQIAAGQMSAKMRAVRIVTASNVSKQDLQRRLVSKGEDPMCAQKAVQWLEDLALLDDLKTAQQIVQSCISKGYGLSRAKQALYEKRIPKEYWNQVLADYPDQQDAILKFLRSRLLGAYDQKDLRRAIDALLRKGHSYAQIRRGLETMSLDTDDFPEETYG